MSSFIIQHHSDKKADAIYDYSKTLVPTLPNSDYITAVREQSTKHLNCACETLSALQKQMTAISEQLPEYDVVMEMFGVGKVFAQLIAEIGANRMFAPFAQSGARRRHNKGK